MLIDQAKAEDLLDLCSLLDTLFSQEAEFTPDLAKQQAGLKMIIGNPEIGAILVARKNGAIIGMVNLLYSVSTALGSRVALLEDLVVAADQRSTGVGSQLLEAAIAFAKQNGCRRITLLTDNENLVAQRFYQRQGFSLSPLVPMRLALPPG